MLGQTVLHILRLWLGFLPIDLPHRDCFLPLTARDSGDPAILAKHTVTEDGCIAVHTLTELPASDFLQSVHAFDDIDANSAGLCVILPNSEHDIDVRVSDNCLQHFGI